VLVIWGWVRQEPAGGQAFEVVVTTSRADNRKAGRWTFSKEGMRSGFPGFRARYAPAW